MEHPPWQSCLSKVLAVHRFTAIRTGAPEIGALKSRTSFYRRLEAILPLSWDNDRNMVIRGRRFLHLAPSKGRAKHHPNVCQSSAEGNMPECWRVLAPLGCRSILDEVSRTSANRNRRTQLTMDAMGVCVFVRVYVLVY